MLSIRKSVAFALTSLVAASSLLSASAQSTDKNLSSNFTLVNLVNGENNGQISYYKSQADGGGTWRAADPFTLDNLGDQLIRRQYEDGALTAGSGSVVVSTDGPVGAVVQIQARPPAEVPSFGAYVGVSQGAEEAFLPLVLRRLGTASGLGNSQIIIQNASNNPIVVEIEFVNGATGAVQHTETLPSLGANEAIEFDLDNDVENSEIPEGWFGSATIRSTTAGGQVAVVSNLFSGEDGMQTFNAFTETKTDWGVPLFASRLANSLSSPVAVQNVSGATIPVGGITLDCTKDPASPGADFTSTNSTAVNDNAAYYFNPVVPATVPEATDGWFGACTVDTGTFQTAVFVQLRTVAGNRAGAHEGLALDSDDTTLVFPLYAKRLANGFASAFTIQNLSSSSAADVVLTYAAGEGLGAGCSATINKTIPAGGSLIQNHRLATVNDPAQDNPNSVPQLDANCFGTLTVTSNQPIQGFAQLDLLDDILDPDAGGDPFQAHNAFTVSN